MTGSESTTTPTRRRSFASSGLSYERVAERLGLRLCDGRGCVWPQSDHLRGMVVYETMHWRPRRMTRRGLRNFLREAAAKSIQYRMQPWQAIYEINRIVTTLGAALGVHFPREYADADRARVRLSLARWQPFSGELTPETRKLRRRVQAWARESRP